MIAEDDKKLCGKQEHGPHSFMPSSYSTPVFKKEKNTPLTLNSKQCTNKTEQ